MSFMSHLVERPPLQTRSLLVRLAVLASAAVLIFLIMWYLYDTVWSAVSHQPFTYTMRERPWLLPAFGLPVIAFLMARTSFTWEGRVTVGVLCIGFGVVVGHVYWGG